MVRTPANISDGELCSNALHLRCFQSPGYASGLGKTSQFVVYQVNIEKNIQLTISFFRHTFSFQDLEDVIRCRDVENTLCVYLSLEIMLLNLQNSL